MTTNTEWVNDTCYAVNVNGIEEFVYAPTAYEAIAEARALNGLHGTMGGTARKAVYGEWDCGTRNYTADGRHIAH